MDNKVALPFFLQKTWTVEWVAANAPAKFSLNCLTSIQTISPPFIIYPCSPSQGIDLNNSAGSIPPNCPNHGARRTAQVTLHHMKNVTRHHMLASVERWSKRLKQQSCTFLSCFLLKTRRPCDAVTDVVLFT